MMGKALSGKLSCMGIGLVNDKLVLTDLLIKTNTLSQFIQL